jgi:Domain of unknown function (DUF4157)
LEKALGVSDVRSSTKKTNDFAVLDRSRAKLKRLVRPKARSLSRGFTMHTRQQRVAFRSDTEPVALPASTPNSDVHPNYAHEFSRLEVFPDAALGPFSPDINRALSTAFGESLEGLSVTRGAQTFNDAVGARASVVGSHIFLNDDITESLESPRSMEIIAHEVAHALRPSSRTKALSDSSDSGERSAYEAGRMVRQGLEGSGVVAGSARAVTGRASSIGARWIKR